MIKILPGVIAMAIVVVTSNILVQFLILDGLLTWGAFTYPLAFLVTDVMNRVYGASTARRVVLIGFVVGVVCSLIGSQIMIQGDGFEFPAVAPGGYRICDRVPCGAVDRCRNLPTTSRWHMVESAADINVSGIDNRHRVVLYDRIQRDGVVRRGG